MTARREDVAARWAARADRGPTATKQAKLEAWLAADRRQLGAYARARAVLSRFDRARALGAGFDAAQLGLERRQRLTRRAFWLALSSQLRCALLG